MEQYIPISLLNDFVYSPDSIYLHSLYQDFDESLYKDKPQINGNLNHAPIDTKTYSSSKHLLQNTMFFSQKYGLCGKIDIYNTKTGELIERKSKIKTIYPGYKYQLYAQLFALQEQGYKVKTLYLHSLEDNKRYQIPMPSPQEIQEFEQNLQKLKNFNPLDLLQKPHTDNNSQISIYSNLSF
jgi:CRISPR-associated exonuclease Cas4